MIAKMLAPIFTPKDIFSVKPIRSLVKFAPTPYVEVIRKIAGNDASYTVYRSMNDAKTLHKNRTGLVVVTDGPNKGIYRPDFEFITKW